MPANSYYTQTAPVETKIVKEEEKKAEPTDKPTQTTEVLSQPTTYYTDQMPVRTIIRQSVQQPTLVQSQLPVQYSYVQSPAPQSYTYLTTP